MNPPSTEPAAPRILLVGNYAPDAQESMRRFARMLLDGLRARGRAVDLVTPGVWFARSLPTTRGPGKWLAYLDKFVLFPWTLRRRVRALGAGGIVQICDHSNAMYVLAAGSAGHPVLVVCHDLGAVRGALGEPTDVSASRAGRVLQRWIARSLGLADLIACVSTATELDVKRLIRRPDGSLPRTERVLNGFNAPFSVLPSDETRARLAAVPGLGSSAPFVLNVGSSLPRKNRAGVVRIFASLKDYWPDGWLVFAGESLTDDVRRVAAALGVSDRIVEVVKPSGVVLEALYNGAAALLFPSRFEGFGWPAIEAQACGCPVLCSDAGSLPEVVGGSGFIRSADDEQAFADELQRLLCHPAARARRVEAGLANVLRFRTDGMLDHYVRLHDELAGATRPLATAG